MQVNADGTLFVDELQATLVLFFFARRKGTAVFGPFLSVSHRLPP